jgi:light-regulated signal transduction histidine kinase (bacteriophytochrome)
MRERITTELMRAESARAELAVRNIELSRSNVELEQFVYVASHDLQEPLRKVTSFVQLLQQRYEGELDERADQYIAYAVDGARRMQHLINDLLEFSRVGRTTERLVRVDLRETVDAGLANLDTLIEETQATITVGDLPVVRGDAGLLVSLWQNLVGNSLKFRGEEPPVVVIQATRSGQDWLVTVTDNGIGIGPHFADKIFVIFQRLHSREAYEGTGIGLALAKKIVEFHGGRIWLDTDHHPGTRICFSLPVLMTGQRS